MKAKKIIFIMLITFFGFMLLQACGGSEEAAVTDVNKLKKPPAGNLKEAKMIEYILKELPKKKYTAIIDGFVNPIYMEVDNPAKTLAKKIKSAFDKLKKDKKPRSLSFVFKDDWAKYLLQSGTDETGIFTNMKNVEKLKEKLKVNLLITGYSIHTVGYHSVFCVDLDTYEVVAAYSSFRDEGLQKLAQEMIVKTQKGDFVGVAYLANNKEKKEAGETPEYVPAQPGQDPFTAAWPINRELCAYIVQMRLSPDQPKVLWPSKMTQMSSKMNAKSEKFLKGKEKISKDTKKKMATNPMKLKSVFYGNYAPDTKKISIKSITVSDLSIKEISSVPLKKVHPVTNAYLAFELAKQAKEKMKNIEKNRKTAKKKDVEEVKKLIDDALVKDSQNMIASETLIRYFFLTGDYDKAKAMAEQLKGFAEALNDDLYKKIGDYYIGYVLYREDKKKNDVIKIDLSKIEIKKGLKGLFDMPLRLLMLTKAPLNKKAAFKLSKETKTALKSAAEIKSDDDDIIKKALWAAKTLAENYYDAGSFPNAAQYYKIYVKKSYGSNLMTGVANYRMGLGDFMEANGYGAQLAEEAYESEYEKLNDSMGVDIDIAGNQTLDFYVKMVKKPIEKSFKAFYKGEKMIKKNITKKEEFMYYSDCELAIADCYLFYARFFLVLKQIPNAKAQMNDALKAANKIKNPTTKSVVISYLQDFKKEIPTYWKKFGPKKAKKKRKTRSKRKK